MSLASCTAQTFPGQMSISWELNFISSSLGSVSQAFKHIRLTENIASTICIRLLCGKLGVGYMSLHVTTIRGLAAHVLQQGWNAKIFIIP